MQTRGGQRFDHPGSDHGRQAFYRVEPRGGERPVLRLDAAGGQHQQRQHRHRLTEDLQPLQDVEIVANPFRGQQRATEAGQHQHAQTDPEHPAAIDPAQVAQRCHQRQRNQLRQRGDQHDRCGLRRAITLHLCQITRRNQHHRLQNDQHTGQRHQGERQVTNTEHLQFEKRDRLRPLVDQERHQQQRAGAEQSTDQARLEPVQPIALQQTDHQHADRRKAQQQALPVERFEAFQTQRVLRNTPRDHRHGDQARHDDLPERPLPTDVFGP
ncbi:hypothetical protein D3C72_744920 [compost metagenome]